MKSNLTKVLFVAVMGVVLWWPAQTIFRARRYNATRDRIQKKINVLRFQLPTEVSEEVWDGTVSWGCIAFGNICATESHTSYEEMCHLECDLDAKLAGPIDIAFFEWLWSRLAETGPHGAGYVSRIKWTWDQLLEWADSAPADAAKAVNSRTL